MNDGTTLFQTSHFLKYLHVAAHGRASFLISNIGCLGDVFLYIFKNPGIFCVLSNTDIETSCIFVNISNITFLEILHVAAHGRASFLIPNIGCLGNVFILHSNITLF